jgi:hypothetical protein
MLTPLLFDGGFDFEKLSPRATDPVSAWTPLVLPTLVALTTGPKALTSEGFDLPAHRIEALLKPQEDDQAMLVWRAEADPGGPPCVLLPFDKLFEVRIAAALHLWRKATGRRTELEVGRLSPERRKRLILALQALDARLLGASHRQVANALFDAGHISGRDWITHDLRDRTGRLIRLGASLMNGGYRRLLLHPYRRLPEEKVRS